MAKKYDYIMTFGVDENAAMEEVLKTLNMTQKKVDDKRVTVKFQSNMDDVTGMLNKVSKLRPEIGTTLSLELDRTQINKQFDALSSYANKSAKEIGRMFKNEFKAQKLGDFNFETADLRTLVVDQIGDFEKISEKRIKEALLHINDTIDSFKFEDVGFDDIIRQAETLEKRLKLLDNLKGHKNYANLIDDSMFSEAQNQTEVFYKNVGTYIKNHSTLLTSSLKRSIDIQNDSLNKVFSEIVEGMSRARVALDLAKKDAKELTDEYKNLQNTLKLIKQEQDKTKNSKRTYNDILALGDSIEIDLLSDENITKLSAGTKQDAEEFVSAVQKYVMAGNQLDDNLSKLYSKFGSGKYKLDSFIPLNSLKTFETQVSELTSRLSVYQQAMNLKGIEIPQNIEVSKNLSDDAENITNNLSESEQAIRAFKEALDTLNDAYLLDTTDEEIDELTKKVIRLYRETSNLVGGLGKKNNWGFADTVVKDIQESLEGIFEEEDLSGKSYKAYYDSLPKSTRPPTTQSKEALSNSVSDTSKNVVANSDNSNRGDNVSPPMDTSPEIENLEKLKSKIKEVENAVNDKTQAFSDERIKVDEVVVSEISALEQLETKLKNISEPIEKISNLFKSLKNVNIEVNLKGLDNVDFDETSMGNLNQIVSTIETLNGLNLRENFSDDIKQLIDAIKQFKELKGMKTISLENLKIDDLVDSLTDEKINKLFELSVALESILPQLQALSGLKISKANVNNMSELAIAIGFIADELKKFEAEAVTSLKAITDLVSQADGLKKLHSITKDSKRIAKISEALERTNEPVEVEDKSEPPTAKEKQEEEEKIAKLIKQYNKLEKEIKDYVKLKQKAANEIISDVEAQELESLEKEFKDVTQAAQAYINKSDELADTHKRLNQIWKEQKLYSSKGNIVSNFKSDYSDLSKAIPQSQDEIAKVANVEQYKQILSQIKNNIEEIEKLSSNGIINGIDDDVKDIEKLRVETDKLIKALKSDGSFKLVDQIKVKNLDSEISSYLRKNTNLSQDLREELSRLQRQLLTIDSEADFDNIKKNFTAIKKQADSLGQTGMAFVDKWKNKLKDLGAYLGSFASFYEVINLLRQGLQILREYDDALTEMRKVSDQSVYSLRSYQAESFDIADKVGTTAKQIQQSTADYLRLGEAFNKAQESAQTTSILKNVSEFESIDEATESMVAMSQAYSELDKTEILDLLNFIGNKYPIATDALSRSLQRSAATLKTAGNDIYEATALTVAGNRILQDEESVGTALKTISLRMLGTEQAKAELASLGDDTSDYVVQTKSKINEQLKKYTAVSSNSFEGVSLLDDNGNYRSTYKVLQEIADVYQEIVETDKQAGTNRSAAVTELLGGKMRASVVSSILMSPEILRKAYEDAQNSSGSAQEELNKYLDSVSGKIEKITNRAHEFWFELVDSDGLKAIIDLGSALLGIATTLTNMSETIPGVNGLFTTIGALVGNIIGFKNVGKGKMFPFFKGADNYKCSLGY